jgi:DNA-directed RNA polymerase subunit RPC12/RpoP
MSNWKSINLRCQHCNHLWHDTVERGDENLEDFECPECGSCSGVKTLSAPSVMRSSYPDGKRRFNDLREVNSLRKERADSKNSEKTKINREIRKLRGRVDE